MKKYFIFIGFFLTFLFCGCVHYDYVEEEVPPVKIKKKETADNSDSVSIWFNKNGRPLMLSMDGVIAGSGNSCSGGK